MYMGMCGKIHLKKNICGGDSFTRKTLQHFQTNSRTTMASDNRGRVKQKGILDFFTSNITVPKVWCHVNQGKT